MKLFTTAAMALMLSAGMALAQDSTTTGSTGGDPGGGGSDASNYLAGPNIHRFYTDDTMDTLRPEAEMKSTWEAMTPEEQANLREACKETRDSRWSTLCNSIGTM